jgi:hypothetical protein
MTSVPEEMHNLRMLHITFLMREMSKHFSLRNVIAGVLVALERYWLDTIYFSRF